MDRVHRARSEGDGDLRVRSGCITCIARRLECDGRKPTCLRCENSGVSCSGYASSRSFSPGHRESRVRQHRQAAYLAASNTHGMPLTLRPGMGHNSPQLSYQASFLHHFRTSTLSDLMMSSGQSDFWGVYVIPLGHTVEPVKCALSALGGLHRKFKTGYGSIEAESDPELGQNAIRQYNQAITHLHSFMEKGTQSHTIVVIVCCVIFICIEVLQGRYSEALRHLKAGSKLLASLEASSNIGSNTTTSGPRRVGPELIKHVSLILRSLAHDISFYVGGEIIPELTCQDLDTIVVQYPVAPFSSPAEAEKSFRTVQRMDNAVRHYCQVNFGPPPKHSFSSPPKSASPPKSGSPPKSRLPPKPSPPPKAGPPPKLDPRVESLWGIVNSSMHDWVTRFEIFKGRVDETKLSEKELYQMRYLSVHQAMWAIHMKFSGPGEGISIEEGEDILSRIELLLKSINSNQQAVFTFNSDLIPTIYFVFITCPDLGMKQKCIDLLRGMRRKEGIWDSEELAEILERAVIAQGKGLMRFDGIPMQVPELAKALSSMKLSKAPKSNIAEGILAFQRE